MCPADDTPTRHTFCYLTLELHKVNTGVAHSTRITPQYRLSWYYGAFRLCPGGDLNPHVLANTGT